jgi:hypothetical protein
VSLTYVKPEHISLKAHPELNELWVRDRIREDPTILRLGDLEIKDAERMQPKAGRIDLLLRDPDTDTRYEVELMLGATDESHIIRCIEYWDIERKRYPQYDHVAVLIAEDVTSRFLNVIGLFNSAIPIIAMQISALRIGDSVALSFAKVVDLLVRGEDDEDEQGGGQSDRSYWEKKASKESLAVADQCLDLLREIDSTLSLKYNKYYVGLQDPYRARNFVLFRGKKTTLRIEARITEQDVWMQRLEEAGIEVLPGQKKRARLVFKIAKDDVKKTRDLLLELFRAAYDEAQA